MVPPREVELDLCLFIEIDFHGAIGGRFRVRVSTNKENERESGRETKILCRGKMKSR